MTGVEHSIGLELGVLFDAAARVQLYIEETGEVYWDSSGPGHTEYSYEITLFSLVYLEDPEIQASRKEWHFDMDKESCIIPEPIVKAIFLEVEKWFNDLTQEEIESIVERDDS